MLLTLLSTYVPKICFSRDGVYEVCSLVDVWAARLVTMDKLPQLRTIRRYDSDAYVGVWVWLLFFSKISF